MHTLAIADDHELCRRGLKQLLTANGKFNIEIEASNGEDLLTQLAACNKMPDACILDISMPVMNGYEAMRIINKKWPELKVLVLSMHKNDICIVNMIRNGARGYVFKGSPAKTIVEALTTIITEGYYHSEIDSILLSAIIQNKHSGSLDLSCNELKFLQLACSDLNYNKIATLMNISPRTVDGYRDTLFKKFNVKKRTSLAMVAMHMGLAPDKELINTLHSAVRSE